MSAGYDYFGSDIAFLVYFDGSFEDRYVNAADWGARPAFTIDLTVSPSSKTTTSASDFTFTAPTTLTAGAARSASVTTSKNGMGTITVYYSSDNGTTWSTTAPSTAGTYKVAIDVTEGTSYKAGTKITADTWTFTLSPSTTSISGEVAITGTTKVGQTLTASYTGGNSSDVGINLTYKWYRDTTEILGATSNTYTLVADDKDHTIKVKITGTGSYSGDLESTATATVTSKAATERSDAATFVYTSETESMWVTSSLLANVQFNNGDLLVSTSEIYVKPTNGSSFTIVKPDETTEVVTDHQNGINISLDSSKKYRVSWSGATVTIAECVTCPNCGGLGSFNCSYPMHTLYAGYGYICPSCNTKFLLGECGTCGGTGNVVLHTITKNNAENGSFTVSDTEYLH